jgi:hypothetical protein
VTDPHARLCWARYAHTASYQLHGPYDPLTRCAARTYAGVLAEQGHVLDAYRIRSHLLVVARLVGPPGEVITAQRHLAEAHHAISHCEQAATEIHHALNLWQAHHTPPGEGSRILASYAAILAGCGQTGPALRVLQTYSDLLRTTDLSALAARLAAAEQTHPPICRRHRTRTPPSAAPDQREADWQHTLLRLSPRRLDCGAHPSHPRQDSAG